MQFISRPKLGIPMTVLFAAVSVCGVYAFPSWASFTGLSGASPMMVVPDISAKFHG
jgi:hypothetical protein